MFLMPTNQTTSLVPLDATSMDNFCQQLSSGNGNAQYNQIYSQANIPLFGNSPVTFIPMPMTSIIPMGMPMMMPTGGCYSGQPQATEEVTFESMSKNALLNGYGNILGAFNLTGGVSTNNGGRAAYNAVNRSGYNEYAYASYSPYEYGYANPYGGNIYESYPCSGGYPASQGPTEEVSFKSMTKNGLLNGYGNFLGSFGLTGGVSTASGSKRAYNAVNRY